MADDHVVLVPVEVGGLTLQVEAVRRGSPKRHGPEQTSSHVDRAQATVTAAFERAQDAIVAVASSTVATMGRLGERAVRPQKVEVKFGLKFAAEGSVIIAGASGEATLEVTLTYAPQDEGVSSG